MARALKFLIQKVEGLYDPVTAKLICVFVFTYANNMFSHKEAHLFCICCAHLQQVFSSKEDHLSRIMKKQLFAHVKTKWQNSCAVTAQLISASVIATQIEPSLYFLNPEFQVSNHLLWLYSPVCVRPGPKPQRPDFSQ